MISRSTLRDKGGEMTTLNPHLEIKVERPLPSLTIKNRIMINLSSFLSNTDKYATN
jgi:hypothetical protein